MSKVARCAENAADIYHKTSADYCTQLIFCDVSTPKSGFNIYDEPKRLLIGMGVPHRHPQKEKDRKKAAAAADRLAHDSTGFCAGGNHRLFLHTAGSTNG